MSEDRKVLDSSIVSDGQTGRDLIAWRLQLKMS